MLLDRTCQCMVETCDPECACTVQRIPLAIICCVRHAKQCHIVSLCSLKRCLQHGMGKHRNGHMKHAYTNYGTSRGRQAHTFTCNAHSQLGFLLAPAAPQHWRSSHAGKPILFRGIRCGRTLVHKILHHKVRLRNEYV
jgi:hypothetical protein